MSLYAIRDAIQAIGLELRAAGEEADKAAAKVRAKNEATNASAGMSREPTVDLQSMGATSLGSPSNATDQMARMIASLDAAKRR